MKKDLNHEVDETFPEGSEAIEYAIEGDENSAMLKTLFPYDPETNIDLVTDLPANTPALISLFELYAEREQLYDFLDFTAKLKRYLISKDRMGRREGLSVINWAWAQAQNDKKQKEKDEK